MLLHEMQMEGSKWFSSAETVEQALIMPMFSTVFNQSNQEINKSFHWLTKIFVHKGGNKTKNLIVKRQGKILFSPFFCSQMQMRSQIMLVCVVITSSKFPNVALFM